MQKISQNFPQTMIALVKSLGPRTPYMQMLITCEEESADALSLCLAGTRVLASVAIVQDNVAWILASVSIGGL
ncbi:hypothetical protein KCU74_g24, partial [Aureobasidium melanogenum]